MTAPSESPRRRAYLALEGGRLGGMLGAAVEYGLVTLIVLNAAAYTLQSVPEFEARYAGPLAVFENISIFAFAVEYVLRVWTAPEEPAIGERGPFLGRLRFVLRPMMLIDFIAVGPAILAIFVPFFDLRVLRLIRLLRLLKIARYSPALAALTHALIEERRALYGSLLLFLCALLLFAGAMHAIEGRLQPKVFGTIPDAMWWAVSTLTTVGYGDAVPLTPLGRLLAGVAMIVGLGLAALPVGIVATGFANSIHRRDFVVTFGMVARVPIFRGFSAQTVGEIMDLLRASTIGSGDVLSLPGERAAAMYFVVAGEIEVQLPEHRLRFSAGDFFGELALLGHRMRDAAVIAVRTSRVLALSVADFESLVHKHPGLKDEVERLIRETAGEDWLAREELAEAKPVRDDVRA
jgi:voltage-gated potassium channel